MTFSQKFIIHPIGQGLFYSGTFKINTDIKFRMVFDCGNRFDKMAADNEVKLYRDTDFVSQGVLDLLIISHFDEDHVSHIGKLLHGGIKVKTLIMPFITFQERLFLVLRVLIQAKGYNSNNEFIINFILDPLTTLKDNLNDDSYIYIIDDVNDLEKPIPPAENGNVQTDKLDERERFIIDFEEKDKSEFEKEEKKLFKSTSTQATVFKVNHTTKGIIKTALGVKLMELLFYKRKIGQSDKDFFDKIEDLFCIKYSLEKSASEHQLDAIVNVIKNIKSSSPLKKIFIEAKQKIAPTPPQKTKQYLKIIDPNTTALCLLHKNLVDGLKQNRYNRVTQTQKFVTPQNRINIPWLNYTHWNNKTFPNVLLTSDTFLLNPVQVTPFVAHYKHYWNDFWLFQIPHHGSEKNSDSLLHSNIPLWAYNFINYGIPNKDKHPNQSVINSLVATGHSIRLISITQYQGLSFEIGY